MICLTIAIPWGNDYYNLRDPLRNPFITRTGDFSNLGTIIATLIPYILAVCGVILLLMIIASGYSLLTSAGNPEGIEKGKKRLTTSILGFIIIIAAYWIWQLVALFLGFGTSFPSP